jgi:hypothetical protein
VRKFATSFRMCTRLMELSTDVSHSAISDGRSSRSALSNLHDASRSGLQIHFRILFDSSSTLRFFNSYMRINKDENMMTMLEMEI